MSTWSAEMDEKLRAFSAQGRSFSEIAELIGGVSRNACIGRLRRLGVTKAPAPAAVAVVKQSQPPKAKPPLKPPPAPPKAFKPTERGWPKPITATAKLIVDLAGGDCRMPLFGDETPIDERFFCGAPTGDIKNTWCPSCHAIVYDKTPHQTRRAA